MFVLVGASGSLAWSVYQSQGELVRQWQVQNESIVAKLNEAKVERDQATRATTKIRIEQLALTERLNRLAEDVEVLRGEAKQSPPPAPETNNKRGTGLRAGFRLLTAEETPSWALEKFHDRLDPFSTVLQLPDGRIAFCQARGNLHEVEVDALVTHALTYARWKLALEQTMEMVLDQWTGQRFASSDAAWQHGQDSPGGTFSVERKDDLWVVIPTSQVDPLVAPYKQAEDSLSENLITRGLRSFHYEVHANPNSKGTK